MRPLSWVLGCALLASASASPAQIYSWSISGSGFVGSGTFTIDGSTSYPAPFACTNCADGPGYRVTSITGTLNGNAITGLEPLNMMRGNDNLFFAQTSGDALDWWGIAFTTATSSFDIFGGDHGGHLGDYIATPRTTADSLFNNPIVGHVAPVPEPASWSMMLLGFAAIGFAARRRSRSGIAPAAN